MVAQFSTGILAHFSISIYNKEFLLWANSPESVEKKKQIYISDFVAVFGRFPEGWAQEELESANGTEVAPAPEEFISPETDGAVNMDDPAV